MRRSSDVHIDGCRMTTWPARSSDRNRIVASHVAVARQSTLTRELNAGRAETAGDAGRSCDGK
jgi:hypothetical protein